METNNGVALAALALNMVILGRLVNRGLLALPEIREDIDQATLLLEQMGLNEAEAQTAHHTLLEMLRIISGPSPAPTPPPRTA